MPPGNFGYTGLSVTHGSYLHGRSISEFGSLGIDLSAGIRRDDRLSACRATSVAYANTQVEYGQEFLGPSRERNRRDPVISPGRVGPALARWIVTRWRLMSN